MVRETATNHKGQKMEKAIYRTDKEIEKLIGRKTITAIEKGIDMSKEEILPRVFGSLRIGKIHSDSDVDIVLGASEITYRILENNNMKRVHNSLYENFITYAVFEFYTGRMKVNILVIRDEHLDMYKSWYKEASAKKLDKEGRHKFFQDKKDEAYEKYMESVPDLL